MVEVNYQQWDGCGIFFDGMMKQWISAYPIFRNAHARFIAVNIRTSTQFLGCR